MPRPNCGVPCTLGCLQDLRQAPNLLLVIRPVCSLGSIASERPIFPPSQHESLFEPTGSSEQATTLLGGEHGQCALNEVLIF